MCYCAGNTYKSLFLLISHKRRMSKMETFNVSQDIDISYIEEQIEKKLAAQQLMNENKKTISRPVLRQRTENSVKEKTSSRS